MENEEMAGKVMKVEIPCNELGDAGMVVARQGSMTRYSCLCSPTTHAGSFRCRLHRSPSLHRTKSIESSVSKAAYNDA